MGSPPRLRPGTAPQTLRTPPHGGRPSPQFRRGGSRSTLAGPARLRRVGVSIPATCGRRGITPAFGYGPPHPGAGGTSTLLTCAAWRTLRTSPPPCSVRPGPRGLSVGACHAAGKASRVASIPLFHTCRRHYPGGTGRCSRRSLPDRWPAGGLGRHEEERAGRELEERRAGMAAEGHAGGGAGP